MNQTFTHNDLLNLIYGEINDCCTEIAIKKELLQNESLAADYRELKKSVSLLNANELSPKPSTIAAILERSKEKQLAS